MVVLALCRDTKSLLQHHLGNTIVSNLVAFILVRYERRAMTPYTSDEIGRLFARLLRRVLMRRLNRAPGVLVRLKQVVPRDFSYWFTFTDRQKVWTASRLEEIVSSCFSALSSS